MVPQSHSLTEIIIPYENGESWEKIHPSVSLIADFPLVLLAAPEHRPVVGGAASRNDDGAAGRRAG